MYGSHFPIIYSSRQSVILSSAPNMVQGVQHVPRKMPKFVLLHSTRPFFGKLQFGYPTKTLYERQLEAFFMVQKCTLPNDAKQVEYLMVIRLSKLEASWEIKDTLRHEYKIISEFRCILVRTLTIKLGEHVFRL